MNFRELLKECNHSEFKLQQILEEREKYKARAEKITSSVSEAPSRSNAVSDKVGDGAIMLAEVDKKLDELEAKYSTCRLKALAIISQLDNQYYDILHAIYFDDITLYDYADKHHYSYYTVAHIHGEALKRADDIAKNSNF